MMYILVRWGPWRGAGQGAASGRSVTSNKIELLWGICLERYSSMLNTIMTRKACQDYVTIMVMDIYGALTMCQASVFLSIISSNHHNLVR